MHFAPRITVNTVQAARRSAVTGLGLTRLYSYHVKDMRPDRSMTAVGNGTIDFASLFRLPGSAGVRHFYVENDEAVAPYLPDITTSFNTLHKLRF